MSGIFGIVRRDGGPLDPALFARLRDGMTGWDHDGCGVWSDEHAGLGQARTVTTPEDRFERLPVADAASFAFTAEARLDNLAELRTALDLHGDVADGDLVLAAYRRWGERAPQTLLGDWSFAAWHPAERRLFLARDHYGHTSLYWTATAGHLAFSSSRLALQALRLQPVRIDELYIAQYLISWPAYHGERTTDTAIHRLCPAHTLAVTPTGERSRCYWNLEDELEPLELGSRAAYADRLREVFDDAVRSRLRAAGPLGAELSSGLDSSSVVATAAAMLRDRDPAARIAAFTAVPSSDTAPFTRTGVLGDELPFAQATARHAGNVDVHAVTVQGSPIEAIREYLDLVGSPIHAASNAGWLIALPRLAREQGCTISLNGRRGNCGFSWPGFRESHPRRELVRLADWPMRRRVMALLPAPVAAMARRGRRRDDSEPAAPVNPEFAARLRLYEARAEAAQPDLRAPLAQRVLGLQLGRAALAGPELAAELGLRAVDPTTDTRLLATVLAFPDRVFFDPRSGTDRIPTRDAMADRLPDSVRLGRHHGLQSADLVPRLRLARDEVDAVLAEIARSPAAEYVDSIRMRESWDTILTTDEPRAHMAAVADLTRPVMAALHVNDLVGRA